MSTEVGSIHYELDLDKEKFNKGTKEASGQLDSLSDKFEKAQGASSVFAAGMAAVGAAAIGFGASSVKAYLESETALSQLQAVIKSTGKAAGLSADYILEQATELEHLTGVSDEAVVAGQSMLLTFTNIKGKAFFGATEAVLDMATAMNGGAIPSMEQMRTQAIMVGKALNDPVAGITKLTKVGVTFTEAQKQQIETLAKNGKTMEAQQVILKELSVEFGGSATAAGKTFTGQLNIMKETFGDFQELVGESIVNHMRPMIEAFNKWYDSIGGAEGFLELLNQKLRDVAPYFPMIAGAIIGGLTPALIGLAVAVGGFLLTIAPWLIIGALIGQVIKDWIDSVGGLSNAMDIIKGKAAEAMAWYQAHKDFINTWVVPAVEGLTIAFVALKAAMLIGQVVQGALGALTALRAGLALTTGSFTLLGGAIALLPLSIVIAVAAIGIMEILNQFKKLKEAMDGLEEGKQRGYELDNYIFKQAQDAKAAGDMTKYKRLMEIYATPNAPKFASGVTNFSGGLAYVHKDEALVNLPPGTDVIPKNKMGGGDSYVFNISGVDKGNAKEIGRELGKEFLKTVKGAA